LWRIMVRVGGIVALVVLIAMLYLLFTGQQWNYLQDTLALTGFALGMVIAGLTTYRFRQSRIRTLRHERVALAQSALTAQLREAVTDGLVRVYTRLNEVLSHWNRMLAE